MRLRRFLGTVAPAVIAASLFGPAVPAAAAPANPFFSEYVEGSGSNKAFELYNPGSSGINLYAEKYQIQIYLNGSKTPSSTVNLTGKISPGRTFVVVNSKASKKLRSLADQLSGENFPNGNDAVVLRRGKTVIDSIGQVGYDPGSGWGSGMISTAGHTLRRITAPDTTIGNAFDPAEQWAGFPRDTFDNLGSYVPASHDPDPGPSPTPDHQPKGVLRIGEVQGSVTDAVDGRKYRSPLAPKTGNGSSTTAYDVQGVVTELTLGRTADGTDQRGFFLQSRLGTEDQDLTTSDGVFVFTGKNSTLLDGYVPKVGDEVIIRAKVAEYFSATQLTNASLVKVVTSGLDVKSTVAITDATPPADSAMAARFWERHEGELIRVRAGSVASSGRGVFGSTKDAEVWLVDREDPLAKRSDPYARRVFRDPHPLDNDTKHKFDDGNGQRILLGSLGVKAAAKDSSAMLPPARMFDTLTADVVGGLSYGYEKYTVQPSAATFTPGVDPSLNNPVQAADRDKEFAVSTYNVENLYDFRDDPFDNCDFKGNSGCPGVKPPFDYVPSSEAAYQAHVKGITEQIIKDLHSPDLLLVQEVEDQDICTVKNRALVCGNTNNADGKPDVLQEVALGIAAAGGPAYDAAYDRDGADARGITSAFFYRTDRLTLSNPTGVLSTTPNVTYRAPGLKYNADVSNPKALNAELPADIDVSTGKDGNNVYTRAAQVARFTVAGAGGDSFGLWAVSNHFGSVPQTKVGQRREQAGYGAAITKAIEAQEPGAPIVYGGDLNVFPRPDDPIAKRDGDKVSDQLGPLYEAGMHNLWDDLAAATPASAYSYVFEGQGQTLDHIFVNAALYKSLVRMQAAHINAGWPVDYAGDGARGVSDHDPQVATFRSRTGLSSLTG